MWRNIFQFCCELAWGGILNVGQTERFMSINKITVVYIYSDCTNFSSTREIWPSFMSRAARPVVPCKFYRLSEQSVVCFACCSFLLLFTYQATSECVTLVTLFVLHVTCCVTSTALACRHVYTTQTISAYIWSQLKILIISTSMSVNNK